MSQPNSCKALLCLSLLAAACTAATPRDRDSEGNGCVAGQSIQCFCTNGAAGAQVCAEDGTYGECACESDEPDGGPGPVASDGGTHGGTDGGALRPDGGVTDSRTPCQRMCDHVYEDCKLTFSNTNGQPINRDGCVNLCNQGSFSTAQRTCFTNSACAANEINRCFNPGAPLCPQDANCSSRQCGLDPVCATSCGTCADGQMCSSQQQCVAAHGWVWSAAQASAPVKLSLASSPTGVAHVVTLDDVGDVRHGQKEASGWKFTVVERVGLATLNLAQHVRVRVDAAGEPHLVYHDDGRNQLRYARSTGTNWAVEAVNPGKPGGADNELELDSQGRVHAVWRGEAYTLMYGVRDPSGTWTSEPVMSSWSRVGFALDAADRPHIAAYAFSSALRHGVRDGDRWVFTDIATQAESPQFVTLALSADGTPHVIYKNSTTRMLRHAFLSGTAWTLEDVVAAGSNNVYNDAVFDNAGRLHVVYQDSTARTLRHAIRGPTGWTVADLDTNSSIGTDLKMARSNTGLPWLLYNTWRSGQGLMFGRYYP